jgi:prepilin-type N-terminal cleavage/methylation domain-containing protein
LSSLFIAAYKGNKAMRMNVFSNGRSSQSGFTMLELLVVVGIIGLLMGILLPVLSTARKRSREAAAKHAMDAIAMAMEKYRDDFRAYPPDDQFGPPTSDPSGSEALGHFLCKRFPWGETHYGPYLENVENRLRDPSKTGNKQLLSPNGGNYRYIKIEDTDGVKRRYMCVEAGLDQKWGGDMDPTVGWLSSGQDVNSDGEADDVDNIFSSPPPK